MPPAEESLTREAEDPWILVEVGESLESDNLIL
jgi:hypothetical protein